MCKMPQSARNRRPLSYIPDRFPKGGSFPHLIRYMITRNGNAGSQDASLRPSVESGAELPSVGLLACCLAVTTDEVIEAAARKGGGSAPYLLGGFHERSSSWKSKTAI
jgi:hypothetical protein